MKFSIITLLMSTSAVLAADVCRPTGSDCGGNAVCCTGIQENNCCNLGGSSTRIRFKLPANSRAQGWSGTGCNGNVATTSNPNARTVCLSYSASRGSGKWLTGLSSRVKRESGIEACAEPNVVLRVRDGVTTKVDIRDGMTVEDALAARDDDGIYEATAENIEYVSVVDDE